MKIEQVNKDSAIVNGHRIKMNRVHIEKYNGGYYVDLSSGEQSPVGKILCHLFYKNDPLLSLAPYNYGYPHNGGRHSFHLKASKDDILAFMDLMIEFYIEQRRAEFFITGVAELRSIKESLEKA